jgi:hypothetical protein
MKEWWRQEEAWGSADKDFRRQLRRCLHGTMGTPCRITTRMLQGHISRSLDTDLLLMCIPEQGRIPVYFFQPFVDTLQVKLVFAWKSSYLFSILIFS